MKKTILHIIDSLGRGGAETMLVTVIRELSDFNHIVVTLYPENEFGHELKCDQLICLHMCSPWKSINASKKLRKIIKANDVSIVHSHLFWSTVVARLAVPKQIPLVSTIHSFVSSSIEYRPWRMKMIERYTFKRRKSTIITVAKGALEEYFNFIKITPTKAYYLYTFVDTTIFTDALAAIQKPVSRTFTVLTVGNLKEQKNHRYLLEAFSALKDENIQLDIYGKGKLDKALQKTIDEQQLKVVLKGQVNDIQQHIKKYDLFVMPSLYEGFSLSVLEAMALGMPLLLSKISSFREQCGSTALYFSLLDSKDFINKLIALKNNRNQLQLMGDAARDRVLENYTLEKHMLQLRKIYATELMEA